MASSLSVIVFHEKENKPKTGILSHFSVSRLSDEVNQKTRQKENVGEQQEEQRQ